MTIIWIISIAFFIVGRVLDFISSVGQNESSDSVATDGKFSVKKYLIWELAFIPINVLGYFILPSAVVLIVVVVNAFGGVLGIKDYLHNKRVTSGL